MKALDLLRIEHKLDLVIRALQEQGLMIPELPTLFGIEEDTCPVCNDSIRLVPDFSTENVQYTCACTVPTPVVRGISAVMRGPDAPSKPEAAFDEASGGDRERRGAALPGPSHRLHGS